jgi:hypothetical protein
MAVIVHVRKEDTLQEQRDYAFIRLGSDEIETNIDNEGCNHLEPYVDEAFLDELLPEDSTRDDYHALCFAIAEDMFNERNV